MLIPQEGDIILCIVFAGINGFPIGAKFLAESILADIIDYDEFITGTRSEATYTMFKSFLPKICAIPASAIPIALLNVFGHVPVSKEGRIQLTTGECEDLHHSGNCNHTHTCFNFVLLPESSVSIKTKEQVDKICIVLENI